MTRRAHAYEPKPRQNTRDTRKRIARGENAPQVSFPRPIVQEPEDDDRFYVVEQILQRRINKQTGCFEVFVKWENYTDEHNSWEPEEEIKKGCADMIKRFINGDNAPGPNDPNKYCTCKRRYQFKFGGMVQCLDCFNWYHFKCIKMNMEEANSYARWYCDACRTKNPLLKCKIKAEKLHTFHGQALAKRLEESI